MDIARIHKAFATNRYTIFFSIFVFIVLRLLGSRDWCSIQFWSSTFIQIGIALCVLLLSIIYDIIHQKSFLPAFFYLLFAGTNPTLFDNLIGSISAMFVVVCLFVLFATYQNSSSQVYSFNIAVLITFGSLYWCPLLLFYPLFWLGMYLLKSLNCKSFLASLLGFFVVYLFLLILSIFLKNDLSFFLENISTFRDLQITQMFVLEPIEWFFYGFWGILFVILGIKFFSFDISEKVRTVIILKYLWILSCIIFVMLFVQNQWKDEWSLIMYSSTSLIIAHFFTLLQKKVVMWLLLFIIIGFLTLFFWKIILQENLFFIF